MQRFRKALIVSVMMMTVFSLSVVVAPQADAIANGDVIKMNGLSSVYYVANGKRYVFPNEATYFSWYPDFSNVMVVAQSELELYPLAANVTMRPGTKLVTSPSNSMVYAVEPGGVLRSIVSEENAINLFGANWANTVVDVIDAFFTNYNLGTPLTVGTYPTGSLIKTADSADVYYVEDGKARKFADEASFVNNRFSFDNVKTAATLPALGVDVTGVEATMTDTSSGAGGTPNAGTGLTVSVAGDTAPSRNIPSLTTLVPFVTVNLTAASDGDVRVDGLTFTRRGTGEPEQFDGGYLFVGDERLTNKRSVNTSENTINFNALNLTIPAGMTKQVVLKMNDNDEAGTERTGNHYFSINAASAVVTNGATVSGSFPMGGNTMTYSSVEAATVDFQGTVADADRKIGETGVVLGEFDIVNNNQEKVNINRIRLKNAGTAGDDAVNNISLEIDGVTVVEGVTMADKYIDFMFETPFEVKKSETLSATIRGDVQTDINKKLYFYLNNVGDVDVRGTQYGDFYSAYITRATFDETTGEASEITIKGSEIDVSFDGPQATETKDDVKDLILANFKVKANNLGVNMETLTFTLTQAGTSNGATYNLDNVELVDTANNSSYSVSDPTASGTQSLAFENVMLQKGVQYNFQLRADVPDSATVGITYTASLNFGSGFTAYFQDADETAVGTGDLSASSLSGKTMTVAAPAFYYSKVSTTNTTVVKDAKGVLLYKGKLQANSVDNLKVTRVPFTSNIGHDDAQYFGTDWSRVYLYKVNSDGTETKLDDEDSLSASVAVNFTGFTLDIPKGTSNGVYIVVRGDVKSSPSGTTTAIALASSGSWTVKDSDNNAVTSFLVADTADGHTTTVATVGTYTLAIDKNITELNSAQNLLAGGLRLVGRIKATAAKETAKIEDLVLANYGSATVDSMATVYLYDNKELSGTALGSADVDSNKKVIFDNVNIEIPTTGSTYLYLGALVKTIDYSNSPTADATGVATTTIALYIPADAPGYDIKVLGVNTGDIMSDSSAFSSAIWTATSTILGAKISAVGTDFVDATLPSGTGLQQTIFSFKVTAPNSSNVDVDGDALPIKLSSTAFAVATSGINLANVKIERVGGANSRKTATVTYGSNTMTIDFATTYGTDQDLEIIPGATATYKIIADTVGSDGSGDSVSLLISNINTDMTFTHNTGVFGVEGPDTISLYPLLSGDTTVQGGALSN